MPTLRGSGICCSIPIFLIIECTAVLDLTKELFTEEIELLGEGDAIHGFDTSDHHALYGRKDRNHDQRKYCHTDHEFHEGHTRFTNFYHVFSGKGETKWGQTGTFRAESQSESDRTFLVIFLSFQREMDSLLELYSFFSKKEEKKVIKCSFSQNDSITRREEWRDFVNFLSLCLEKK